MPHRLANSLRRPRVVTSRRNLREAGRFPEERGGHGQGAKLPPPSRGLGQGVRHRGCWSSRSPGKKREARSQGLLGLRVAANCGKGQG